MEMKGSLLSPRRTLWWLLGAWEPGRGSRLPPSPPARREADSRTEGRLVGPHGARGHGCGGASLCLHREQPPLSRDAHGRAAGAPPDPKATPRLAMAAAVQRAGSLRGPGL